MGEFCLDLCCHPTLCREVVAEWEGPKLAAKRLFERYGDLCLVMTTQFRNRFYQSASPYVFRCRPNSQQVQPLSVHFQVAD
jgi:hypothetical protein